ncbi:MAG TPA: hypothetical protein VMZ03_09935, partial [Chitinophagaceae bacterium]|nr:hypothetical protein [Chitinophagaceae bacterium]
MKYNVYPGEPFPLGATWDSEGVNFAVFAENADGMELCLFDNPDSKNEEQRIRIKEVSHHVWHAYIPGLNPGQLYGYRAHGIYDPLKGYRYNPNKLLIDPYAKAISQPVVWNDALFGYIMGHPEEDLSFSDEDSAPFAPRSVVIDTRFDWQDDKPPRIPYHKTIIYETHIKGFTKTHPAIPENIRGTYAAIAHPVTIEYLKKLGITAVELMPVHHFIIDKILKDKGLNNYWGYNTIGYFAPDIRYSNSGTLGG